MVVCGEHCFPAVEWEGGLVPEARSYRQTVLPHQTGVAMDALFPRAEAAKDPGDRDLWGELCELERAGLRLAKKETKNKKEPQTKAAADGLSKSD